MGATAVNKELSTSTITLGRVFCAEGIFTINSHRLFNCVHTHLNRMILGQYAFISRGVQGDLSIQGLSSTPIGKRQRGEGLRCSRMACGHNITCPKQVGADREVAISLGNEGYSISSGNLQPMAPR